MNSASSPLTWSNGKAFGRAGANHAIDPVQQALASTHRGRAMGGSSTINGQIAIRAVPDDLDRWEAQGCEGWGWQAMLPYFCKLETDKNFPDAAWHGDRGPIPVGLAVVGAVLLGAGVAVAPARARPPAGRIVFADFRGGPRRGDGWAIRSIRADGRDGRDLSRPSKLWGAAPLPSPDGAGGKAVDFLTSLGENACALAT